MTKKKLSLIIAMACICFSLFSRADNRELYKTVSGRIYFRSDAPLEVIEASSTKLKGVIDPELQRFAFTIPNNSFEGFNSSLQKEHFNENYLESDRYPNSTFTGKIIEQVDLNRDGDYTIRSKGLLKIHGVEQERIIKSNVRVRNGILTLKASFTVPLADHNISIPRIVNQKIAEEIYVDVEAEMKKE